MALLAVNKNGTEIISKYELYRNGYRNNVPIDTVVTYKDK